MSSPLRILFALPYVPSPIRVRPFQFVRHLVQRGHRVTIAALADGFASESAEKELREICDAVHIVPHTKKQGAMQCLAALPTKTPLWAAYCRSEEMSHLLRRLAASGDFDVAHVEHLRAAHFAPDLGELPAIFDAVDCITALREQMMTAPDSGFLSRQLSALEWRRLRTYEPLAYSPYSSVAVTSAHDKSALAELDNGQVLPPITVIPNGVDSDFFRPNPLLPPDKDTLVFSGKMSYGANEDAARFLIKEVMPRLWAARPKTKLIVAGSQPSPALQKLAASESRITVTGFVEDLRPFLSGALFAVCPMRIGVGIQNKALEAMAMGRVALCSPLAGRALAEAEKTGAVRIAEADGERFAAACLEFLNAPEQALKAGGAARCYVETHHEWERAAGSLEALYTQAREPKRERTKDVRPT